MYGNDVHTAKALVELKRGGEAVTISILNELELANALRLAEFRRLLAPGVAAVYLADYDADVASGRLVVADCNLAAVVTEARRLSAVHTRGGGHRAFDILHVAAALQVGADTFLTFDAGQRKLAAAAGLRVRP